MLRIFELMILKPQVRQERTYEVSSILQLKCTVQVIGVGLSLSSRVCFDKGDQFPFSASIVWSVLKHASVLEQCDSLGGHGYKRVTCGSTTEYSRIEHSGIKWFLDHSQCMSIGQLRMIISQHYKTGQLNIYLKVLSFV